ncbi:MAG: hypothetical protein K8R48_03510 [Alphaproteobacteria bacterium]|nr:hypothetical protein [Alphaproteobacteria bacterium]
MKKLMTVLFVLLLAQNALAAEETHEKPLVTAEDCRFLTAYQPSPGTEYQPGVDVRGKPVVEADLTPSVIQPPEKYSFDLTVDVMKYIGLTEPTGVLGETKMGTVTVEKGKIMFNGKPLGGDAEAALVALCAPEKAK